MLAPRMRQPEFHVVVCAQPITWVWTMLTLQNKPVYIWWHSKSTTGSGWLDVLQSVEGLR